MKQIRSIKRNLYISVYKVFFSSCTQMRFQAGICACQKEHGDKFSKTTDKTAFRYRVKSINLYVKHAAIALALHKSTVFISHVFADSLEW